MSKLTVDDLPLSSFLIDKKFRLYNQIRSRINSLEFQRNCKHHLFNVTKSGDLTYFNRVASHISLLRGVLSRLEKNSLICNSEYLQCYQMFKSFPHTIKDHTEMVLGFYIRRKLNLNKDVEVLEANLKSAVTDIQKLQIIQMIEQEKVNVTLIESILQKMKENCRKSRKIELAGRVVLEALQRNKEGWFIVLNTLTCHDNSLSSVFADNSKAWTDFIRSIDRCIGIEIYGSWRGAVKARREGDEFHTYFAVVERGDLHGRPHVHCLHFIKKLPSTVSDPNFGRTEPYYKELKCFKKYWTKGILNTKIIRIDSSDAYGKLQWRWPSTLNERTGKYEALKARTADSVVSYLTSYLNKEFDQPSNEKEIKWRTRKSQILGKKIPQMIVNACSTLQLELICRVKSNNLFKIKNKMIPMWTLKKLAMTRLLKKNLTLTPMKCWNYLMAVKSQEGLLKRLKSIIRGNENHKLVSFGNLRTMTLLKMVGSSLKRLVDKISIQEYGEDLPKIIINGSTTEVRYA